MVVRARVFILWVRLTMKIEWKAFGKPNKVIGLNLLRHDEEIT